jgi:hypothetical protein
MTDNHTPLDHTKLPKQPQTVRVSPESPPITINETKPAETQKPTENLPLEEAKEHKANDDAVKPYIEEKPENIELPPELKSMGLKAVTQTSFPNYQNVKLPITDDQVLAGQNAPVNSSMRWLAEFAKFLLWRAHISLKTVGGRVVRVIKK